MCSVFALPTSNRWTDRTRPREIGFPPVAPRAQFLFLRVQSAVAVWLVARLAAVKLALLTGGSRTGRASDREYFLEAKSGHSGCIIPPTARPVCSIQLTSDVAFEIRDCAARVVDQLRTITPPAARLPKFVIRERQAEGVGCVVRRPFSPVRPKNIPRDPLIHSAEPRRWLAPWWRCA